jgi:F-type H+-transporting ATPase subunit delta
VLASTAAFEKAAAWKGGNFVRIRHVALARRYARALLEVATEAADPAALRQELQHAARLVRENEELRAALSHPAVGAERKRGIVEDVWSGGASVILRRLLLLLVERGRLGIIEAVASEYGRLWNEQRGVASAELVSAVALDTGQHEAIAGGLRAVLGRGVEIGVSVDPQILGGLRVQVGGVTYDGSVRARIEALRSRLLRAGVGG